MVQSNRVHFMNLCIECWVSAAVESIDAALLCKTDNVVLVVECCCVTCLLFTHSNSVGRHG